MRGNYGKLGNYKSHLTDVIIDYFRNRESGKSAFASWRKRAEILITSITTFELLLGTNLSSKSEERKSYS